MLTFLSISALSWVTDSFCQQIGLSWDQYRSSFNLPSSLPYCSFKSEISKQPGVSFSCTAECEGHLDPAGLRVANRMLISNQFPGRTSSLLGPGWVQETTQFDVLKRSCVGEADRCVECHRELHTLVLSPECLSEAVRSRERVGLS